jgi:sugar O-acyltransferase (sialic acid O-acetyltransferase NeuD family)
MTPDGAAPPDGGDGGWAGAATPLHLLGTGLLAEELCALALHAGIPVAAFVENLDRARAGATLCGRPILWVDDLPPGSPCVCALSTTRRERYVDQVRDRARFVRLVHPSAQILPGGALGAGTVVSTGVLVGSHTRLGEHVFVNRGVAVGHHTTIGDFVTLQPRANVAGVVSIGDRAWIGMGAIVTERLTVGAGAVVAAGAVVLADVPERCLVAGAPATVRKRDIEPR